MMYMQNMPGYKNDISYNGRKMRNWWDIFIDYDNAYAQAQCLYDSCDGALSLPMASQINKNISVNSNCNSDTIIKTAGDTTWIVTIGKDGVTTAIPAKGNPLKEKQLIQVECEENEL